MKVGNKITDPAAVLLRQVHPNFFVDGRPSSIVFKPQERDGGLLSVHQEALITAERAYRNHVEAGFGSCGVVSVTVAQCASDGIELSVVEAPLSTADEPPDECDDPAHASIDFRGLAKNACEKKARKLATVAWAGGWRYRPT